MQLFDAALITALAIVVTTFAVLFIRFVARANTFKDALRRGAQWAVVTGLLSGIASKSSLVAIENVLAILLLASIIYGLKRLALSFRKAATTQAEKST